MKRREVLKATIGLGVIFVAERILPPDEAEAAAPKAKFFEGDVMGTSTGSLWLATSGKFSRGFAHFPGMDGEFGSAWRVAGGFKKNKLDLKIYDGADVNETLSLGSLTGAFKHGAFTGDYSLTGGGSGSYTADPVKLNGKALKGISGSWQGTAQSVGGVDLFSATLNISTKGTYEVRDILRDPNAAEDCPGTYPTRMIGKIGVTTEQEVWLCPTPVFISPQARCYYEYYLCPPVLKGGFTGTGSSREVVHPFDEDLTGQGFRF